MSTEISASSTEYLFVPFTANVDPETIENVSVAFIAGRAAPEGADWHAAEVVDDTARILVGPEEVELPVGSVRVWIQIDDLPENVVEQVGVLIVTD